MSVITYDGENFLLDKKRVGLNLLTLRLFKNDFVPGPLNHSPADFTEADFDGYASQLLDDFGAVFLNGSNESETDTGVHTFVCTGNVTPNTIYGWYATIGLGTVVLAERNPSGGTLIDAAGKNFAVVINFKSVGV